jgi:hypothetical protein
MTIKSHIEHRRHAVGLFAASAVVGLALGASACSASDEEGARSATAEMQPDSFTFAPPDGTHGVRTDHRRYEAALVGTPLRNLREQELRWNIDAKRSGDQFIVSQELAHVTMKHDEETLVDRDVKSGAVVAQLIIDKAGNLVDVRGLEGTSKTLQSLFEPRAGSERWKTEESERDFSPQNLKALIATRYEETLGEIVGRPTKVGSSWTTQGREGGPVISRTITVEKTEPCGQMVCSRLQAVYKMNPKAMLRAAEEIVGAYARWSGQAPSKLNVQAAMYSMQGMLLTEPATMINHAASLDESGKVLFEGPKQQMEIDLKGKIDISFEYTKPVATEPGVPSEVARP